MVCPGSRVHYCELNSSFVGICFGGLGSANLKRPVLRLEVGEYLAGVTMRENNSAMNIGMLL